jgi:RHS repeat-associated protein
VYTCPSGLTLSGTTCSGNTVTPAGTSPSCNGWGSLSPDASSSSGYLCGEVGMTSIDVDAADQACTAIAQAKRLVSEGFYSGGPGFMCRVGPVLTLSCPSGSTLSGSSCIKPVTQAATIGTYSCSAGTLSGSSCVTTSSAAATVSYSCPSSATLSGSSCSTPTSIAATKTYSCATGTLSGSNCNVSSTVAASVTYSCASGTLSVSQCLNAAVSQAATVTYSCPSGATLSGSTCTGASSTQAATATYSCPTGGTLSGTNCVTTTGTSQAATVNSYSCPGGGTLSGSSCTTTTSVGATAQLGCPSGGTLSGNTCIGANTATSTAYVYLGSKQIAEVTNGVTQYVHTDALGSPVAHTNAIGGLMNRTRYEPYGYPFAGAKPSVNTSVIGFTGHVQDAETDLVYMQQRYYDPIAGRFLSVDPVTTDAATGKSFGRYQYANNNPYRYIDGDGREPFAFLIKLLDKGGAKIAGKLGDKADAVAARKAGDNVLAKTKSDAKQIETAAHGKDGLMKHDGHELKDGTTGNPHFQSEGEAGHTFWGEMGGALPELLEALLVPIFATPGARQGSCRLSHAALS